MSQRILITGGAGFIGSHVADELLESGYRVRVLDVLSPQVHGPDAVRPTYLNPEIELIIGDVRDREVVDKALRNVDAVFHFAAMVGVAQSMYEIDRYTSVNNFGTAVFLQSLIEHPVERLIVASSMSIYGEGVYRTADGRIANGVERDLQQLKRREWELLDESGDVLTPMPTPESKQPSLASIYALSKFDQERMCLLFGRTYKIPTVALRLFNVYGTRQALSNPYTGVLAIFASRLLNNRAPIIFEDGLQRRDFVSVKDVAHACRLGGAGFIGSNLAHRLLSSGERVLIFDRLSRPGVENNLEWLIATHGDLLDVEIGDVRNPAQLKSAVGGVEKVFHFAAQVAVTSSLDDPLGDFETNARGTLNLLEAIRATATPPPLIFTSTNKVYGALRRTEVVKRGARYVPADQHLETTGISEQQSLDFCSPYGCSKGAAVIDRIYARN